MLEIHDQRNSDDLPGVTLNPSAAERFGGGPEDRGMSEAPRENPFRWTVPEGWEELQPSQLRLINLRPAGDARAECALTVLSGGGTLTDNVNRWRNQIGLDPISEEEVERLPRATLLGQAATIVDLRGTYTGMGSVGRENWGLLGLILSRDQFTLVVKMTAPAELIAQERPKFETFCATITTVFTAEHGPDDGHDHGSGAKTENDAAPASDDVGESIFGFQTPEGWRPGPRKVMREVNLLAGESSQCWVVVLSGEAGGLEQNINRWRGEVSLDGIGATEIAAMPKIEILGSIAPLLEVDGDYQGMGGPQGGTMTLLGVPLIRESTSVFVKMVGPSEEIAAQREHFIEFVESLVERK